MTLYAKNNTGSPDTWVGQEIQPNTYYQIPASDQTYWGQDDKVITDIGSANLIIALTADNNSDLSSPSAAINYLRKETPTDSDGAPITKQKIVPEGWSYQLRGFDVSTNMLNGFVSKDAWGNAKSDVSIKHYDAADIEITTQNDMINCEKSIISFEPAYNYAIVGGLVFQDVDPAQDLWIGVVAAPDVPKIYGGSVEFGAGINLKHIGKTGSVNMDGRAPKILTYDPVNHTSKLHVILTHAAGFSHSFHLLFEIFQPPGV